MVRTMFFERGEFIKIHGVSYPITNQTNVDHYNCRGKLTELLTYISPDDQFGDLSKDNYQSYRKELIRKLKEFDKKYTVHGKKNGANMELMNDIMMVTMKPLTELLASNNDFYNLNQIIKEGKIKVPEFRFQALEVKFSERLTRVCEVLRDHGEPPMKEYFDIPQQLKTLKTENWKGIPPLAYYFQPLEDAQNAMIKVLLEMFKLGPLRCKYIIPKNEEMVQKITEMIKRDITVQWLAGNELKQDQFKFLYDCMKVLFDTPLRALFLNPNQYPHITDSCIPNMVAYKSMLRIRDIDDKKAADAEHEKQKADRK